MTIAIAEPAAIPRGVYYLAAVEMWERFSFFGMRAVLLFYLTEDRALSEPRAIVLFAGFAALSNLAIVIGGHLADALIGPRRAVTWGTTMMLAGSILLTVEALPGVARNGTGPILFLALTLLAIGTGPLKCGATTMVGALYADRGGNREAGFTLYYIGINLGSGVAAIVCGVIGSHFGWWAGFGVSAVGLALGAFIFRHGRSHYADVTAARPRVLRAAAVLAIAITIAMAVLVFELDLRVALPAIALVIGLTIYIFFARGLTHADRMQLDTIYLFLIVAILYWSAFVLTATGVSLFIRDAVERTLLGYEVPAAAFQGLEPILAIVLGPLVVLAMRGALGRQPFAARIAIGLTFAMSGYVVLAITAASSPPPVDVGGVLVYFLMLTIGDLIVAPAALSHLLRVAPHGMASTVLGLWYLAATIGHVTAGSMTTFYVAGPGASTDGAFVRLFASMALLAMTALGVTWLLRTRLAQGNSGTSFSGALI